LRPMLSSRQATRIWAVRCDVWQRTRAPGRRRCNLGLLGLARCLPIAGGGHAQARESGDGTHESLLQALRVWPQLVDLYLGQRGLPATSVALVAFLRRPWWDLGLSDEDSRELEHALQDLPPSLTQDGLGELPHEIGDFSADELGPESHGVAEAEPPHEVAEFSASELPEEGMSSEPPMRSGLRGRRMAP